MLGGRSSARILEADHDTVYGFFLSKLGFHIKRLPRKELKLTTQIIQENRIRIPLTVVVQYNQQPAPRRTERPHNPQNAKKQKRKEPPHCRSICEVGSLKRCAVGELNWSTYATPSRQTPTLAAPE